jgi:hypothetical protein
MKKFLVLMAIMVLTKQALAAPIGSDCPMEIAGVCFTKAQKDRFDSNTVTAGGGVTLHAFVLTSGRFSYLHMPHLPSSAFQVGAAVTLRCPAAKVQTYTSTATGVGAQLVYSDDAATYDDTTMTSIVYQNGVSGAPSIQVSNGSTAEMYWGNGFTVPSNKYPSFQASGAAVSMTVYCFVD